MASSTDGLLDWEATDGEWAIAVLNTDGSAGVDVAVTGAARIPFASLIGAGLLVAGLLSVGPGGLLTYYGVRAVRTGPVPSMRPGEAVPAL